MERNGSVALLSGTEQFFTLVYMKTPLVWNCIVIYAATELHIYSLHLILYMQILIVSVLTDKPYSNYATALYEITS